MSAKHTTLRLLSKQSPLTSLRVMSNRARKSGVSNITSWHQTARALPSPINSLFPPFSHSLPFTPIHHSTTHHHTRKSASAGSLSMQSSKASKQAPMSFQKISKFSHWYNPTYKSFIYRYTYLQAPRNKVFWSDTSHAYGENVHSYAPLAARYARGDFFLTLCM